MPILGGDSGVGTEIGAEVAVSDIGQNSSVDARSEEIGADVETDRGGALDSSDHSEVLDVEAVDSAGVGIDVGTDTGSDAASDQGELAREIGADAGGDLGDGPRADDGGVSEDAGSMRIRAVQIAVGFGRGCAVLSNDSIRCWGTSVIPTAFGLESNTVRYLSIPAIVPRANGAVEVTFGNSHSCVRLRAGTVACWGGSGRSEAGVGLRGLTGVVQVAAGRNHTCALQVDGRVACWGSNEFLQVGPRTLSGCTSTPNPQCSDPVAVPGLSGVAQIVAYGDYTCARLTRVSGSLSVEIRENSRGIGLRPPRVGRRTKGTARSARPGALDSSGFSRISFRQRPRNPSLMNGTIECWGHRDAASLPAPFPAVRDFSVGESHRCAVLENGSVHCWGDNSRGQLGDGTTSSRPLGVPVRGLSEATDVECGPYHSCALLRDGTLHCWGANSSGQLGDGSTINRTLPRQIAGLDRVLGLALGDDNTCVVLDDGTARCWGNNSGGAVGDGTAGAFAATPQTLPGISASRDVSVDRGRTCVLLSDDTVRCWGSMAGTMTVTGATQVVAGRDFTCARLTSGSVRCWGGNDVGQIGDGTTVPRSLPYPVMGLETAISLEVSNSFAVDPSYSFACSRLMDGTIRCWGANGNGQLGNGTTTGSPAPVMATGITDATDVAVGGLHVCARLMDGRVRCWGAGDRGQRGDGTLTRMVATPVMVTGLANAIDVAAGATHSCARIDDLNRSVVCWGDNASGQIGNTSPETVQRTPDGVFELRDAAQVSLGSVHSCARITDGTVRCWGSNSNHELGDGTGGRPSATVRVPGLSRVVQISASADHTCARIDDGTVRCWGLNTGEQLGFPRVLNRLTPTPVVGLSP